MALDAIGAWADTYARLPWLPWLRDEDGSFLAAVDEVLAGTIFSANPALRAVDARLCEALDELTAGNAAQAPTRAMPTSSSELSGCLCSLRRRDGWVVGE